MCITERYIACGDDILRPTPDKRACRASGVVCEADSEKLADLEISLKIKNNSLGEVQKEADALEKRAEDLKKVYNRGFWDGYYLGQRVGEWTKKYGSQATTKKTFIGTVTNYFKNISVAEIKIETGELNVGDNIYIMGTTTGVYEDTVEEIRVDLQPTQKTVKGDFCSIATKSVVRRGDKLYLIENTGVC